jgi:hypothetical protein
MKATIICDEHDYIISIAKVVDLKQAGSKFAKAGIIPGNGQRAIHVELSAELEKMHLRDIHKHYRVDHATSKLVRKQDVIKA